MLLPPALAPSILLVTLAAAQEKCFIHFNQCFILGSLPPEAFHKGKSLKIGPINTKEMNMEGWQGGQAERAVPGPQRIEPTAACLCPPNPVRPVLQRSAGHHAGGRCAPALLLPTPATH